MTCVMRGGFILAILLLAGSCRGSHNPEFRARDLTTDRLLSVLGESPFAIAVDAADNIFIADQQNCAVWKMDASRAITAAVGIPRGSAGSCDVIHGGTPTTLAPSGVAVDRAGNLYVADFIAGQVLKVSGDSVSVVAACPAPCGADAHHDPPPDNNPRVPSSVAVDDAGNVFIADYCRVLKLANGQLGVALGTGECPVQVSNPVSGFRPTPAPGSGTAANSVKVGEFSMVATGPDGPLYVVDLGSCVVWKVSAQTAKLFAGTGQMDGAFACQRSGSDGTPALRVGIDPKGIAADGVGNVFISDSTDCSVRYVDTAGMMRTAATHICGAIAVDPSGRVYVLSRTTRHLVVLERVERAG